MANEKPPCAGKCERRTPTCHSECRDYGEYAAMQRAKKAAIIEGKKKRTDWTHGKSKRVKMPMR